MVSGQAISLAQAVQRGQIQNEARVAEQINPPKLDISTDELKHWRRFKQWCAGTGVRFFPARPCSVAAWIENERLAGCAAVAVEAGLRAIEIFHANANLANPVACSPPREELLKLIGTEAPRSWSKSEWPLWATVPPEVRSIIKRRDLDSSRAVRKAQNEAGELRQKLKQLQDELALLKQQKGNLNESQTIVRRQEP